MADLGVIGVSSVGPWPVSNVTTQDLPRDITEINTIWLGTNEFAAFADRDDTDGNPEPPCQKQTRAGSLKDVFAPVRAGVPARIQIDCKYEPDVDPRPRIIAKANESVGLLADLIADAVPGAGWQTIAIEFTPTADGVVNLWRELRNPDVAAYVKWDNAAVVQ